jgi:hypothetical protein
MNGNKVSVLNPALVDRLTPEEAHAAAAYGATIRTFRQQAALRANAADEAPASGPAGRNDPFTDDLAGDIPAEYADESVPA